MPELPEVETMVRGIRSTLIDARVVDLVACPTHCRPITIEPAFPRLRQQVRGRRIQDVFRLGKRVVMAHDDDSHVVIEPRMTGLMLVGAAPDPEHLRLEWRLDRDGTAASVWFWDRRGLGTVTRFPAGELQPWFASRLGPDPLTVSAIELVPILQRTSRAIKVALLDQKLLAGIGNLYASEILHRARIHPETPADRLKTEQVAAVHTATISILEQAIRYEGSTLGDGTYRNALNQSGGYQNAHQVYDREGETCRQCGSGVIERFVQAQRATFYCPVCQPKPRRPPRASHGKSQSTGAQSRRRT